MKVPQCFVIQRSLLTSYVYFTVFFVLGGFFPFWAPYISHFKFNLILISIIVAIFPASRVVSPFLRSLMSNVKTYNFVLACALFSFFFIFLQLFNHSFIVVLFSTAFFSIFWYAIIPLIDSQAIEASLITGRSYGLTRVWGSIGFLFGVLILGFVLGYSISYFIMLILFFILITFIGLSSYTFNYSVRYVYTIKDFASAYLSSTSHRFLLSAILLQFSFGSYYGFFSLYLLGHGFNLKSVSLLWFVSVASEIVFFFVFRGNSHHRYNLLVFSYLSSIFRWLIIGNTNSFLLLLIAQAGHSLTFAPFHLFGVRIMRNSVNEPHRELIQILYSSLVYGLGISLGIFFSGVISYFYNISTAFDFSSVISFIALIVIITEPKNKLLEKL